MKLVLFNKKWITGLFIIYAFLFFYRLTEIGPEYDESLFVNAALGCPNKFMFLHLFYPIGKSCAPIMVMPYIGATQAYFLRVVFTVFGPSVFSLRLTNYLLMLMSFLLLFTVFRKVFKNKIALLALVLLILDPHILLVSRYDRTLVASFFLKSLLLFVFFGISKKYEKLKILFTGFLLGFSIYTKSDIVLLIVIIIMSMVAYSFIYKEREAAFKYIKKDLRKPQQILLFAVGFLIGIFPLLLYIRNSFSAVINIGKGMGLVKNDIARKIFYIVTQFSAGQFFETVFTQNVTYKFVLATSFILFCLFCFSMISLLKKRDPMGFFSILSILFYFVVLTYSGFGSWGKSHHMLMLYPVPQILISYYFLTYQKKLIMPLLLVFLITFFVSYYDFMQLSAITCGRDRFSCSIREVVKLLRDDRKTIVAGDWGLATPLLLLTKGKHEINEFAFDANNLPEEQSLPVLKRLRSDCSYFVLYTPEHSKLLRGRNIISSDIGKDNSYEKHVFFDREKKPILEVYNCKNTNSSE